MIKSNFILIAGVLLLLAFALGRYSAPAARSVDVKKETDQVKDVHTHTETTTIKLPDGEVKTVIIKDSSAQTETVKKDESVTTVESKPKINLSALLAVNPKNLSLPNYGLSISKEVAGPITAGIWVMNNGTIGLSVGIDF